MNDEHESSAPNPAASGQSGHGKPAGEKTYWLDVPSNVHKIYYGVWVVSVLLVLTDLLYEKHPHFDVEYWFGFYGFYGFVSCVSLVLAAKVLRKIVMRPEDYYDE